MTKSILQDNIKRMKKRQLKGRERRNGNTVDEREQEKKEIRNRGSEKKEEREALLWKRKKKKRCENKLNQFSHQHLMFRKFFIASLFVLVLF
jgi:hypothetical protein